MVTSKAALLIVDALATNFTLTTVTLAEDMKFIHKYVKATAKLHAHTNKPYKTVQRVGSFSCESVLLFALPALAITNSL